MTTDLDNEINLADFFSSEGFTPLPANIIKSSSMAKGNSLMYASSYSIISDIEERQDEYLCHYYESMHNKCVDIREHKANEHDKVSSSGFRHQKKKETRFGSV